MTLDLSKPTDQALNAAWPSWIRELATEINAIEEGVSTTVVTTLELLVGASTMTVGVELSIADVEIIFLTATGAVDIEYIYDGTEGQIKIFIIRDNNITFTDGAASGGRPYLNQVALSSVNWSAGDIVVLANTDGDGGSVQGYWHELFRTLNVK